ncbi:hypothetical protein CLV71_10875 [Actinophytocola oryzae]|uniref:Uncharacterized protein n=1 Tax=Actinophytocola oryzae TaxID=502181 RepID=A0A4R7VHS9_9PSEU|nr:hypothetical protein CLV71_10875 [Actinophytocola oryzae]
MRGRDHLIESRESRKMILAECGRIDPTEFLWSADGTKSS